MARYVCTVCGYVHDDEKESTPWNMLPEGWTCPVCGAAKSAFQRADGGASAIDASVAGASGLPNRAVLAHRVFGYVFLALYVVLLVQMIPRLWTYQIEFPARTVLHIALGMAIGTALLLKIVIVRFFRRLDQSLVPPLGTSLLVGSVVLIGFSVPAAFQEALATSRLFRPENVKRVTQLLAQTGLEPAECTRLAEPDSLRAGQRVLRQDCIACHDLRTVLARPRTPESWRQTVRRMADRTTMLSPLEEDQQWLVTAYLIAVSPQLQQSAQRLSGEQQRREQSRQAAEAVVEQPGEPSDYDAAAAKALYESKCAQCHGLDTIQDSPPDSEQAAQQMVLAMVDEGLEATEEELSQIVRYLTETFAPPAE
jgi:rubredoxin/mono/diheme cytochrome c family protein